MGKPPEYTKEEAMAAIATLTLSDHKTTLIVACRLDMLGREVEALRQKVSTLTGELSAEEGDSEILAATVVELRQKVAATTQSQQGRPAPSARCQACRAGYHRHPGENGAYLHTIVSACLEDGTGCYHCTGSVQLPPAMAPEESWADEQKRRAPIRCRWEAIKLAIGIWWYGEGFYFGPVDETEYEDDPEALAAIAEAKRLRDEYNR